MQRYGVLRHRLLNSHRQKAVEVSLAALRGATYPSGRLSTLQLGHDSSHVNVVAHLAAKFVVQIGRGNFKRASGGPGTGSRPKATDQSQMTESSKAPKQRITEAKERLLIAAPVTPKIKAARGKAEGTMPRALQEQLDQVERDIEFYGEFDKAEKARFTRESYLWTAEDRIEWQETQSDNAQRLRELLEERDALRRQRPVKWLSSALKLSF